MTDLQQRLDAIRAAPPGPQVGAFFDYDGTLIDGYSAAAYFTDRVRRGEAGAAEILRMLQLARGPDPTDDEFATIVTDGMAPWIGHREADLAERWAGLFKSSIAGWLFPEGYRLVREHVKAGHTVVIASSATRYQLEPVAREYGIEHLLYTRLGVRRGIISGKLEGRPPWGAGKAVAVRAFADAQAVDLAQSFGYANGNEDIDFLDAVGNPTAINPKPLLATHAGQLAWPRLEFPARRRAPWSAWAGTVGMYAAWAGAFGLGYALDKITGDTRRAVDLIGSVGSEVGLAAAGIRMEVHGEHNLWSHRPAVFILNHQSKLEFLLFPVLVRRGLTGVAKAEAAKVPGFGHFMRMADFAFLDRDNTRSAVDALAPAVERLRRGLSVAMAPEGTRSYSPKLGSFKKGAFRLAMQAQVPIVPVVFRNSAELMPRNAQLIRGGTAQVMVLDPIDVSGWKPETLEQHIAEVRQRYVDTLDNWPGGNPTAPPPARWVAKAEELHHE